MISSWRFHGNGSGSGSELSQWKQTAALIPHHPGLLATLAACAGGPGKDRGLRSLSSVTCSGDRRGAGETASEGQSQRTLSMKDPSFPS